MKVSTIVGIAAVVLFFILLDEYAYAAWKRLHPGSLWTGLRPGPYPLQTWGEYPGISYPNGYRPAGGW